MFVWVSHIRLSHQFLGYKLRLYNEEVELLDKNGQKLRLQSTKYIYRNRLHYSQRTGSIAVFWLFTNFGHFWTDGVLSRRMMKQKMGR